MASQEGTGGVTSGAAADQAIKVIERIFHARSIAVVGATERAGYGARLMNNLIRTGYAGRIYPINPNRSEVFGLTCYPSPGDLPECPDLAIVIVPAEGVVPSLRSCAEVGITGVIVISAGFAELGTEDGLLRHAALRSLVDETGLRVVGPNCLGVANLADNIWATASTRLMQPPVGASGVALISQSGASAFGPLLATAADRGLAFRYIVSTGNEADLTSTDFVEYFLARPDVRVVTILAEGVQDFERLKRLAQQAETLEKKLVVLKVGRSEAGQRAARSHTAALTGSDQVLDALFRQLGIARVRDYDELIEQSAMFLKLKPAGGRRIGVISHSGGIGAHLSDQLGVEGLEVPPFMDQTRQRVADVLGERGSANNPADLTTFLNSPALGGLLDALLSDEDIDGWLVATQGSDDLVGTIIAAAAGTPKPLGVVWTGSHSSETGLPKLQASDVPVFLLPSGAARGMGALVGAGDRRQRVVVGPPTRSSDRAAASRLATQVERLTGALSEWKSKELLGTFGVVAPPEELCRLPDAAVEAAAGFGASVVLKGCGPGLLHKTELGLVRLDLRSEEVVRVAFYELLDAAQRAGLEHFEGVLVQPFFRGGIETIVGLSNDPQLGMLVMLGLGGTLVEALGAVTWRSCPIDLGEAEAMIDDLPILATLLGGVRGAPPGDRAALAAALISLSAFGAALGDRLESVDVNPLLVRQAGDGALALDALVVLR
jgi:acetyltransferase